MNKAESKYFNTAARIDEAFLKLLDQKDFEYITVKEICSEAGVNRSTFYLHYETVGDLLEESLHYIYVKFNSYFENAYIDIKNLDSMSNEELYLITPQYLIPWLNFIRDNKRLFQTCLKRQRTLKLYEAYSELFESVISPILEKYGVAEEDKAYVILFFIEGMVAVVKQWIREDCKRSVEEISALIIGCVKSYEH